MQVKITRQMKTGERRLHLIANLLDSEFFPERRFKMDSWAETSNIWLSWRSSLSRVKTLYNQRLIDRGHTKREARMALQELDLEVVCGTTACALGHATTIPELQDAGLRLTVEADEVRKRVGGSANIALVYADKTFSYDLAVIGREVFGIRSYRTNHLFCGEARTAAEEVKAIRDTIAEINEEEGFERTMV